MAIASIVGGLTAGYFDKWTGTETQLPTDKIVTPLNTVGDISRFAANQALQNITSTALSQALGQGGSFGSALQDTLYNTLAAFAFNEVGNLHLENGSAQKIAAHALVDGLVAEAAGKDFASGAIAAGANEALATELRQAVTRLSPKNRDALLVMSSQLVGLVAAGLVKPDGKGMETGAWIAKNATQYNFLNHERAEDLVEDIHSCKGKPSCERDMWIGSGYNKESLENLDDALKTMGPVRAKDLMTQIQGGLAALGALQCTTPTCENIKFELLDRSFKALDSLDEVYGFGAIVIGGIAGMAGAGGSRPGAGAVPGASSNVNKAYEYWAAVKAERVAGAKGVSPVVTAEGKIGGATFTDVNQTARPVSQANASQPTLISDRVTAKSDASGKVLPNGNMADAHAEIGVIQQAYAAGKTMGASMELTVSGKAVCGYCRGDIAAMAEKSGLTSLTVKEAATGKTLYWQPGMRALREQD